MKFGAKKQRIAGAVEECLVKLDGAIPSLVEACQNVAGFTIRGLSVNEASSGDGYLSVLKIRLDADWSDAALAGSFQAGDYVIYGFGDDLLSAIANLEAQLALDEANLVPDKYAGGKASGKASKTR